jgi:hypothetical protein
MDLPTAEVDLPTADLDLPTAEVDLPTAEVDLPTVDLDLPPEFFLCNRRGIAFGRSIGNSYFMPGEVKVNPVA